MKKYLVGQYYPYLVMAVYGLELKMPEELFEKEVEDQIGEKCEVWFEKLKTELETRYGSSIFVNEVVSYTFKRFSSRDLLEMPYVIDSSLYVDVVLNQQDSVSKVAEFSVLIEVSEEKEKEVLDYLLDSNYYYKEDADEESSVFKMI